MFLFMKKIPGGLFFVAILITAIISTFWPNLFQIGGATQAIFSPQSINYTIGVLLFCSGTGLKLSHLPGIMKKEGILAFAKLFLSFLFGFLFIHFLGMEGIWGISAITFTAVICSTNPTLFLSLMSDYGDERDRNSFGLLGLTAVPTVPLLIINSSQGIGADWLPMISILFPLLLGIILGNLDDNFTKFFNPGTAIMTPFFGIALGANINLIKAAQSGLQGIVITVLFYLLTWLPLLFVERKLLHFNGLAATAMSSLAGLSISVPIFVVQAHPELLPLQAAAIAQIALGVILTSTITSLLTKKWQGRSATRRKQPTSDYFNSFHFFAIGSQIPHSDVSSCYGIFIGPYVIRCAFGNHVAAIAAAFRTEIHDPIGSLDDLLVVLHNNDCASSIDHAVQQVAKVFYIDRMQPRCGFINQIKIMLALMRDQLLRQLQSLAFAAG